VFRTSTHTTSATADCRCGTGRVFYTEGHAGPDYFFAKVVDGGTSGSNGDQIAVLANEGPTNASGDYDMSLGSGTVTGGNLVVH
jgi:hypothetical protein